MEKAQDNIEDVDLLEDYIAAIENWQNAVSNSNRLVLEYWHDQLVCFVSSFC